jgi:hypothetical protein
VLEVTQHSFYFRLSLRFKSSQSLSLKSG